MSFADKSPVAIAQLMSEIGGDGHSILPPQWINSHADLDLHELIEPLMEEHSSNFSHPKLTIFKEGYPVETLYGVRALDLQYQIAADLDCNEALEKATAMSGRSNQARVLSEGILKKL